MTFSLRWTALKVARLLRALADDDDNRAVIIVTHDNRLHDIADRILWLEDGALATLDTAPHDAVAAAEHDDLHQESMRRRAPSRWASNSGRPSG